ncbi:hypothetical protein C9374_002336 [Naegleria lovaniensis]|uniref:V-type proton ATPase proteolipid subunit n=1 Tax=Naegleria lovaniensis TaxID=51637 RepID=A0AA88KQM3_NAELO|nr:uncharacterized protein C9374_002336 [Naegleria lovaniensis]KAG2386592.1 hypothetical protein C9374_002336 [Naegleria lovaniensis]
MLLPLLNLTAGSPFCSASAAFFGMMGCACALIFSNLGSAYGCAKSGVGLAHLGIMNPKLVIKGSIAVIMSGILGIYGLISSIILASRVVTKDGYSSHSGYTHLASGLACGLSCLAAGLAIGVVGDAGIRAYGKQQRLFVGVVLVLIFGEVLGIYGLIVSLVTSMLDLGPQCEPPK